MFKVAICDSSGFYRKKLMDLTLKVFFDTVEIAFSQYESGVAVIEAVLKNTFAADLLLIDIELPQIDGLKTVQFLRDFGIRNDIIFVTKAVEYSLEGYRYGVFDFIQKPISVTDFETVMLRYEKEKIQQNMDFLQVEIKGCISKINLKRVVYFESSGRKITAMESERRISFYQKMDELEEQIGKREFIRVHQSYLINKFYISFMKASEVILNDGTHLPVSKRYASHVREGVGNQTLSVLGVYS